VPPDSFYARLVQRLLAGLDGQHIPQREVIAAAQVYALLDLAAAIRESSTRGDT
jgi:hypothetical protein